MMFMARELGKSLEQLMEISTLELVMWAAFYRLERKEQEKQRAKANGRKYSR
jgi:hypothetical protein